MNPDEAEMHKEVRAQGAWKSDLRQKIESAINQNCAENGSNTPDFILADYMTDCLAAFDKAVNARKKWYRCRSAEPVEAKPEEPKWCDHMDLTLEYERETPDRKWLIRWKFCPICAAPRPPEVIQ